MALRPRVGFAALALAAVFVTACASGGDPTTTTSDAGPSTTTSTTTSTTLVPTTTTTPPPTTTTTLTELPEIDAEVRVPEGQGPFPAVVVVHGGGWVAGNPSGIQSLANHLTANGFLTVNTSYQLATFDDAGFPTAVDDVVCAVRFARAHPDSNGTVAIVGHSAGAHLSALAALTGDQYGGDCAIGGDGTPERLVGLAGPYDTDRLGIAMIAFFGGGPNVVPDAWEEGNPQHQTDANPSLQALVMYGENDGLVDSDFAVDFHNGLLEGGVDSLLELVEGARHGDMADPGWVGDLIVTWLQR